MNKQKSHQNDWVLGFFPKEVGFFAFLEDGTPVEMYITEWTFCKIKEAKLDGAEKSAKIMSVMRKIQK